MTAKVMAPADFCRDYFYCFPPHARSKLHALESKPPRFEARVFLIVPLVRRVPQSRVPVRRLRVTQHIDGG
jgi:hypothetical protein